MINNSEIMIVTNNPMVLEEFSESCEVSYNEVTFEDVLFIVRDLVHLGHTILTHPLSGSIKPRETMYKSVIVSKKAGELDKEAAILIENCINICKNFAYKKHKPTPEIARDFQLIDLSLIKSAF